MLPDERDTIVALATPSGAAQRGVVRVAGPDAVRVVSRSVDPATAERLEQSRSALLLPGANFSIELAGAARCVSADLYVWPTIRSYAGQPSVEVHTVGSTPILEAVVRSLCRHGARSAEPGEFTLRAVLAGRIDLTQAEAILGVIDARGEADLRTALTQLSGGLASPLADVREELLSLLADIEAGLDFVDEEDVRFIEPEEVMQRLEVARLHVAAAASQAQQRTSGDELPLVALAGPPNAGKSTLFNALAADSSAEALVSGVAGSTRDCLIVELEYGGQRFRLCDTAGEVSDTVDGSIESHSQAARRAALEAAVVVLNCFPVGMAGALVSAARPGQSHLSVATKSDLPHEPLLEAWLVVSAATGEGLEELTTAIIAALEQSLPGGPMVASTAARCRESLVEAELALSRAVGLAGRESAELVSMEVRSALAGLGRVLGDIVTDDVLDRIFSRFCIGK